MIDENKLNDWQKLLYFIYKNQVNYFTKKFYYLPDDSKRRYTNNNLKISKKIFQNIFDYLERIGLIEKIKINKKELEREQRDDNYKFNNFIIQLGILFILIMSNSGFDKIPTYGIIVISGILATIIFREKIEYLISKISEKEYSYLFFNNFNNFNSFSTNF